MDTDTHKLFNVIFQEAHVVDFDFSRWDRQLRLVVVAGLTPGNFEGRGPLHNVDFVDVEEMSWRANHLQVKLDFPDEHCQWVIMDFSVKSRGSRDCISLFGFGPTPLIEIVCGDVRVSELDPSVIDRVNPDWNRPSAPLARPGFDELLEIMERKKGSGK